MFVLFYLGFMNSFSNPRVGIILIALVMLLGLLAIITMIKFFCDRCGEEMMPNDICQLSMDVKDDEVVKRKTYGLCRNCRDILKKVIEENLKV